jgi:hypothetical protein
MIAEEWAQVRNCEESRDNIPIPHGSRPEDGLKPAPSGHSDPTAARALKECEGLFQREIDDRLAHIDELRRTREWLRAGLQGIERKDRQILDLAYIGPAEASQRRVWRGKKWREIGKELGMGQTTVRHHAYGLLERIREKKGEEDE